ncbi:UNVERIFIED_CONTAM: hypothetical protein HDU68_005674, partial [Siphonaria sp. JEL0065]
MTNPTSLPPKKRLIGFAATAVFCLIGVVVSLVLIGTTAKKLSAGKEDFMVTVPDFDALDTTIPEYIDILATVQGLDIPGRTARVRYDFQDLGRGLTKGIVADHFVSTQDINIIVSGQKIDFLNGSALLPHTGNIAIDGDFNQYPFDKYIGYIDATATFGKSKLNLPVTLTLAGIPNGFAVNYSVDYNDETYLQVYGEINVSRGIAVKSFAMMITLIMWALALCSAIFTFCLYLFNRKG